ncbi:MAG: hypothetical protein DWG80_03835 [Chloroflexi bacterium]|nr:hypothetical protein [Chloroflexota bacterium]
MKLPDDLKHPSGGEQVDELAHGVLRLTHEAIDRFPDMKRRHMFMAGGAAVSSAVIVAAGVAILHRIRAGARPEDAVRDVTEAEIEGLHLVEREHYRPKGAEATDKEDALAAADSDAPAAEDSGTPPAAAGL